MQKIIILTVLVAAVFTSCQNNDPISDPNSSNNLSTGQIEMKVYPDKNNNVSFYAMTQKMTVDWGDGTINDLTPNNGSGFILPHHVYSNQNLQTVKVNTENMTGDASVVVNSGGSTTASSYWGFQMNTGLQAIKFGNCPELKAIECGGNQLTALDVSKCTALNSLYCDTTQLTSLDISKCKDLIILECVKNQLTSLDISKCTSLKYLNCNDNKLTSLDVSKCASLIIVYCYGNQLSATALNNLFNSLPTNEHGMIFCSDNSGYATCDETIATKKGWKVF